MKGIMYLIMFIIFTIIGVFGQALAIGIYQL